MSQAPALVSRSPRDDHAMTIDDWFVLPDDGNRYELLEGVLVCVPPPNRLHQDIVGDIFVALRLLTARDGGYASVAPLGVALSRHVGFEPDIVYVAPGREDILTDRGVDGVPDIVIEVLSPSTRAFDLGTKLRMYREHSVRETWLVDPGSRTVRVVSADGGDTSVPFGDEIPSGIVSIGTAGLA
jgi:Uma2 family endonuclease